MTSAQTLNDLQAHYKATTLNYWHALDESETWIDENGGDTRQVRKMARQVFGRVLADALKAKKDAENELLEAALSIAVEHNHTEGIEAHRLALAPVDHAGYVLRAELLVLACRL